MRLASESCQSSLVGMAVVLFQRTRRYLDSCLDREGKRGLFRMGRGDCVGNLEFRILGNRPNTISEMSLVQLNPEIKTPCQL